jgi:hypothetical protein
MQPQGNRYWPFDVVPLERQTEQIRREIGFLATAYEAGYKPYMFSSQNFGSTAGIRAGEIIYRGCRGGHWEVFLVKAQELIVQAHVDDFACTAEALLRWLRGAEGSEIVEYIRGHLFISRATAPGFVLHKPMEAGNMDVPAAGAAFADGLQKSELGVDVRSHAP